MALQALGSDDARRAAALAMLSQLWGVELRVVAQGRVPCSQPKSLMRADLQHVQHNRSAYMISPKTDGLRMYMLLSADQQQQQYSVFIDRRGEVYECPVHSYVPALYNGTLFDGEYCQSSDGANSKYVLFDVVASKGFDCKQQPYFARHQVLQSLVPTLTRRSTCSLQLELKKWYPLQDPRSVYGSDNDENRTACDGLIIAHVNDKLSASTLEATYKWKQPAQHTVDMLLQRDQLQPTLWLLWLGTRKLVPATTLHIDMHPEFLQRLGNNLQPPVVVECEMKRVGFRWHALPVKLRPDKQRGNSIYVARMTLRAISENITLEEL